MWSIKSGGRWFTRFMMKGLKMEPVFMEGNGLLFTVESEARECFQDVQKYGHPEAELVTWSEASIEKGDTETRLESI